MVIFNMRARKAAYNLINNNCQNFAMNLLNTIQVGKHREFGTSFSVYQRVTGKGRIMDLFAPEEVAGDPNQSLAEGHAEHDNVMQHAQEVINENTTSISVHNPR